MASPLNKNQTAFASRLIGDTGLDGDVIVAWMLSEEPASAATGPNGANNWLNVGSFDSGFAGGGNNVWDDPKSAADATAQWMAGTLSLPGVGRASKGIQHILDAVGQSPQAQIRAIQQSGWATSGYPGLPSVYASVKGKAPPATGTPFSTPTGKGGGAGIFTVGETTNPHEDYWTAINRLAQEVNWYVYTRTDSPNNVLFLADGSALLDAKANPPVAIIDLSFNRGNDRDKVLYCDFTWDNTAFTFRHQHKKKKPRQAKSAVAKVTSPTECTLHLICNIAGTKTFNPGDVIQLTGCGPGDGPWLVAEVRRSIFQIYAELTLVPGIAPITQNAAGTKDLSENVGANASGSGSGNSQGGNALVSAGGYVNPFAKTKGLKPERIDMGVDYAANPGEPILAIGDAKIIKTAYGGTGWTSPTNRQAGVYYQLTGGAYKGKYVYVTEDIYPTVVTGQKVKAGDTIATFEVSTTGLEMGWGSGTPWGALAASLNQNADAHGYHDPGVWSSPAGVSFNKLLTALGTPSGSLTTSPAYSGPKNMPAGYP